MREMYKNILQDDKFEKGFKLKGLNSLVDGHVPKKIVCGNGSVPPWFLCQWNSRYDMAVDGVEEKTKNGYRFYDESKEVQVENGAITLSLDAGKEYDAPRKECEPWPHLLVEQVVEPCVKLGDIDSLRVTGSFTLTEFCDYMNGKAEEYHTTQFVWVTVIKNVNEKSADFGRFIWVVMSVLDSRYEIVPLYCAQDKALPNGEYIYSFNSGDYMKGKLVLNETQTICFDLYPRLREILDCAKKVGNLIHTDFSELAVTGMNFGFEITGTYKATIKTENAGIFVHYVKEDQK